MVLASGFSALAVPLVVAVSAPAWVSALLGCIAAAGQFAQGLFHDREQGHLAHQLAIKLQKALRDFNTDVDESDDWQVRERFKRFRETFEGIKEEYGSEIMKIRAQDPPQVGQGHSQA